MIMRDERFFKNIKDFLELYLIQQRHYSKNTQKSYREAISLLLQYFKDELGISYVQMGFDHLTYQNVCGCLWIFELAGIFPGLFPPNSESAPYGNPFFCKIHKHY